VVGAVRDVRRRRSTPRAFAKFAKALNGAENRSLAATLACTTVDKSPVWRRKQKRVRFGIKREEYTILNNEHFDLGKS
jgi:hypothetical protein